MIKNNDKIKLEILEHAIAIIPIQGFTSDILMLSAKDLAIDSNIAKLLFSDQRRSFIEFFFSKIDKEMIPLLAAMKSEKITKRIAEALAIRIHILTSYKSIMIDIIRYLQNPLNTAFTARSLWSTVDIIWYEAGFDKSTDHNYYTKRALLAKIYIRTLYYWLDDNSDESVDTVNFLNKEIANSLSFIKAIKQLKNQVTDALFDTPKD